MYSATSKPSPLSLVPVDILLEIASYLDLRADVLHFALASPKLYVSIVPALYKSVTLVGVKQCLNTLDMLNRKSGIARHIQKLTVRPHTIRRRNKLRDDGLVAAAVRRTAIRLDALHTFIWDGDDMCPYDDMWFGLRMFCPRLRCIGTTVGLHVPDVNSHLFDFSGLVGFSIMLRPRFYHAHVDRFADEELPAYYKFWDMLISKCPDLEELSIEGTYSNPADAAMLIEGHWPKLRKLYLGDVVCDWPTAVQPSATGKRPFIEFLEVHPALRTLSLSRHTISPGHLTTIDALALPNLTEFEGTFDQLRALSPIHSSLKGVAFRDPIPTRELAPLSIGGMLQGLPSLTDLRIVFVVHSAYDTGGLLRSLILSCPKLQRLDLTFAHKPSFYLDFFAKSIRSLTRLETLSLSLVKSPGEEPIYACASRIARTSPGLQHFKLTFLPPSFPLPLPFAFSLPFTLPPAREHGDYIVHRDAHGISVNLSANERKDRFWPLGLYVSHSMRRYMLDLRPSGHPGLRVRGLRGLLGLAVDNGKAGEELRMLALCFLLIVLSVMTYLRSVS